MCVMIKFMCMDGKFTPWLKINECGKASGISFRCSIHCPLYENVMEEAFIFYECNVPSLL